MTVILACPESYRVVINYIKRSDPVIGEGADALNILLKLERFSANPSFLTLSFQPSLKLRRTGGENDDEGVFDNTETCISINE